ncbi:MAG: ferritin-like domain-containing protein [Pseudomonadota bacterium]
MSPDDSAHPAVDALLDGLRCVLGDTCLLHRLAFAYRWNAAGPGAEAAEAEFDAQSRALGEALDPIAEHIRLLGGAAFCDYSREAAPNEAFASIGLLTTADMRRRLADGHRSALLSVEAAMDVAHDFGDFATLALLADRATAHRRHIWRSETPLER